MNDVQRESIIDRRVQRRLAIDPAYRNAENAEEQAQREAQIVAQEELAATAEAAVDRVFLAIGHQER